MIESLRHRRASLVARACLLAGGLVLMAAGLLVLDVLG